MPTGNTTDVDIDPRTLAEAAVDRMVKNPRMTIETALAGLWVTPSARDAARDILMNEPAYVPFRRRTDDIKTGRHTRHPDD
jgi:hypothetical protein